MRKDICDFLKEKIETCEHRAKSYEEKIDSITEYMKSSTTDENINELKFNRQLYISKANEILAVSEFAKEVLTRIS